MYGQREKAIREYGWALMSAREEGLEAGREAGEEVGVLKGKIQMLCELLGESAFGPERVDAMTLEELSATVAILQQRLRDREV